MRKRILTNYIIILTISALITGALAFYFIRNSYTISKEEKLLTNISLIQNTLEKNYQDMDNINFFSLAHQISSNVNSRVTFIAKDGIPIADSLNNSIIFENMSYSPEVRHALRRNKVLVKGFSHEIGEEFFYLAVYPVKVGKENIILRLGDNYDEVVHIADEFLLYLVVATIISMGIAILISFFSIGKIVRPVRELTLASKLIAEGNFDNRITVNTKDEIQDLTISFNQMAEKLKLTIEELRNLERMRKDFIANISHELRTPLTSIGGFVETLKTKELDKENEQKALDIIEYETERLKALINELLNLSKIESLMEVRQLKGVYIEECIKEVLTILKPQLQRKDIDLKLEMDNNLNPIMGDKNLLKQLFINLIENAIKYSLPGGEININISNSRKVVKIVVEDNGIGIPKEDIPWIFERFYRVDKSRSINKEGTGLGLAIVHSIVSYFGGTIQVESQLGQGSKFVVNLLK